MTTALAGGRVRAEARTLRLSLSVRVGRRTAVVPLEDAHCEWLLRAAAHAALQAGEVHPPHPIFARLVAGRVAAVHDGVQCLATCRVEVSDARRRVVRVVEHPREVFAAFATARIVRLCLEEDARGDDPATGWALHAEGRRGARVPVSVPVLAPLSVAALTAGARPEGAPDGEWIVSVVTARARAACAALAAESRASGRETAGRIETRLAVDTGTHRFVRILDRVFPAGDVPATAEHVVSTGASWASFLAGAADRRAPSSVHTHLHLAAAPGTPAARPVISTVDLVAHLTAFPAALSAAAIVTVHRDGHETTLYGYGPDAILRREPGFWVLPERDTDTLWEELRPR